MLSLNMKSGDYFTIGEDIIVQVFRDSSSMRVSIQAPREIPIVRGAVRERLGEERPQALLSKRPQSPSNRIHAAKRFEKLAKETEAQAAFLETLQSLLSDLDSDDPGIQKKARALQAYLEKASVPA